MKGDSIFKVELVSELTQTRLKMSAPNQIAVPLMARQLLKCAEKYVHPFALDELTHVEDRWRLFATSGCAGATVNKIAIG